MFLVHACPTATYARQRKGRARPNLSKVCQKTKLCAYHLNGQCERGEECSFAHDESELKAKPDLQCTKLCPALLKTGQCPKGNSCKFAHSENEVQAIDTQDMAPGSPDHQTVSSPVPSLLDGTSFVSSPESVSRQLPSPLGVTAQTGLLSLFEMVVHLTHIFMAMYRAQPKMEQQVGMPANLLAWATAEQAWLDAGINRDASMTLSDLLCWCELPMSQISAHARKVETEDCHSVHRVDSDTWSQISTDEACSDTSEGSAMSPCSDSNETLHNMSESVSEGIAWACPSDVEIVVRNTFIDVEVHRDAPLLRRSNSAPSRPSRDRI